MKKLRGTSLVCLTIGGIFSILLFGLLIILINKINSKIFFYNIKYIILENITHLVLWIINQEIYQNMLRQSNLIGYTIIGVYSFLILMHLIPNYLSKNNGYKKFGAILAFVNGTISCILLLIPIFLVSKSQLFVTNLDIFKLKLKISLEFILLFIGPILTFVGGILAMIYFSKTQKNEQLTVNHKNHLSVINFKTGKINTRDLTTQKEIISKIEPNYSQIKNLPANKLTYSSIENSKNKIMLLKKDMTCNIFLQENGKEYLISKKDNNNKNFDLNSTININDKEQYLQTIKNNEKIIKKSLKELLIKKENNFVKKNNIIKHHNYSTYIFNKKNAIINNPIIIPKSKQYIALNTLELSKRINSVSKLNKNERNNSNVRVYNSYNGKFFLGDIDKIWSAGKKYREDITKKISSNNYSQTAINNEYFDNYNNQNNNKINENY